MGEQVLQTKLLASVILFLITLLCGYLPVRILFNQDYVQYAMFAGGGVLMATAFCHLMPEAHDNYKLATQANHFDQSAHQYQHQHQQHQQHQHQQQDQQQHQLQHQQHAHSHSHDSLPYPEIILCCGFFFMYFIEQLMVRFINHSHGGSNCDTSSSVQLVTNYGAAGDTRSVAALDGANAASAINVPPTGGSPTSASSSPATELYKFIRGFLIVSAFGAHSIFDGVAIGSQESIEKVWTVFLAISCHKLIIAAVVGLELFSATLESHLWTLVHLSIFSIMSPIGIILVVVAQNSLHIASDHPAMVLLQSFATGTLLYIVFVEILQPKENQIYKKSKFGKTLSMVIGFSLMLLVLSLIDED